MPKVSVIVPVYAVEGFIERCVRSLMEQSLDEIEYIFVDDCSPDESISILSDVLDEYPERKPYVKILRHEINKGLPTARLTGLLKSTGDFIIHCDSDDYVDREMYRLMYEAAVGSNYDIVVADYFRVNGDQFVYRRACDPYDIDLIKSATLLCSGYLWNKMIRRSVAVDPSLVFPTANMGEDVPMVVQYQLLSKSVGYIAKPLYYYVVRSNSILGNVDPDYKLIKLDQFVENFNIAVNAIERHGRSEEYKDIILHECLYLKNSLLPIMRKRSCYKKWRDTYSEINSKVLFSRMFTIREKLNFAFTYLGLYPLYLRFKGDAE